MALNHRLVGITSKPHDQVWDERDVMLYALAVGAGQEDPLAELDLTTENSDGTTLRVLPTFANTLVGGNSEPLGDFSMTQLVHGSQAFTVHAPLPVAGRSSCTSTITAIYDKGSAAVMVREHTLVDADTQELLLTTQQSLFIKGEGGFGGDPGPRSTSSLPESPPDVVVSARTRPDQALLYRLTGDRNPLHADPSFAARGGFDRPILHGMCTYGYTGRLLIHALCGSDTAQLRHMDGRFSSPVYPGEELTVEAWNTAPGAAVFRTKVGDRVVLDRGSFRYGD
jgi:acyl dehydratase